MPPRPVLPTGLVAGQSGVVGWLEELNDWHNTETVWKIPAGASRAEAQDIVDDAQASYLGVDGGGGRVELAPGRYDWTGTLLNEKTGLSLVAPNPASTVIYHTGAGPAIRWANNPTTVQQQGEMRGFTLLGDETTSAAVGIHCHDTGTVPAFRDVVVNGFSGAGSAGIWLENTAIWNERFTADRLRIDDCKVGLLMSSPSGSAFNSFGYARVNSLFLGVNSGQIGIKAAGSALVYNGLWHLQFNGGGGTSIGIQIDSEANWSANTMDVSGEALGTGVNVVPGGVFNPSGMWNPGAIDVGEFGSGVCFNSVGHIFSGANLPAIVAMGGNSGAGAPAAVVKGSVLDGDVTFGSGTTPAAGAIMVFTYGWPFATLRANKRPSIVITPMNRASAGLRLYVESLGQTGCVIGCDVAMAASQPNTTYGFTYHVLG